METKSRAYLKMGLKNVIGIYRIVNKVNGNYYFGSSIDLGKRWWEHRKYLNAGSHVNSHLQNAWNLYGADSFQFEVLATLEKGTSREKVFELEQKYLNEHHGKENCYNASKRASVPDSSFITKKSVVQKTKEGEVVKVWDSFAQVERELGILATNVMSCCRGRQGSAGGYRWEYADEDLAKTFRPHSIKHGGHNKRKIVELNALGKIINQFDSFAEAESKTGLAYPMIVAVCTGKRKSTHKRVFKYLEDVEHNSFDDFLDSLVMSSSMTLEERKRYFLHDLQPDCVVPREVEFLFFKDEWESKTEIVKSLILHSLDSTPRKVYARKCFVKELGIKEAKEFLQKNHIAGYAACKISFGLLLGEELVSVISLRNPSFMSKVKTERSIEIARFASKLNTRVTGGFGKLLKRVKEWCLTKGIETITTYADSRFRGEGAGGVYSTLGFVIQGKTSRSFWYSDGKARFPRLKFKALPNKSEAEVAKENGIWRVYGATNNIYRLDLTSTPAAVSCKGEV